MLDQPGQEPEYSPAGPLLCHFARAFTSTLPTPLPKPKHLISALFGRLCLHLGPGETGQCSDKPLGILTQGLIPRPPGSQPRSGRQKKPTGYLERFPLERHADSGEEVERVGGISLPAPELAGTDDTHHPSLELTAPRT